MDVLFCPKIGTLGMPLNPLLPPLVLLDDTIIICYLGLEPGCYVLYKRFYKLIGNYLAVMLLVVVYFLASLEPQINVFWLASIFDFV